MWRFKPSKFKNAAPKSSKKEEWITDVSVGSLPSFSNHIKASAALVAFNVEQEAVEVFKQRAGHLFGPRNNCSDFCHISNSEITRILPSRLPQLLDHTAQSQGNLGIVPLNNFGSKYKKLPLLRAHSSFVTDFDFCPYDDYILSTASEDCHVKVWRLSDESERTLSNPVADVVLPHRVEAVKFHPQADCILSAAEANTVHLWDVNTGQLIYSHSDHTSLVQSISWRHSGSTLASCGQDKKLRIWDARDTSKSQVVNSHYSDRDTKVVWLGNSDQLITTGLGTERQREVYLRDVRNMAEPVATYSGDTSLKAYIPLHDPDTNMLFLVAQADHAIIFCEILDYAPHLQEAAKHLSDMQVYGGALVSKRALSLMDAEVNRLLLLGKDCVTPLSYQVPRKSYRNFHEDLYPETFAPEPSLTSAQWQASENFKIQKMVLNPSKIGSIVKSNHCLGSGIGKSSLDSSNNNSVIFNSSEQKNSDEESPAVQTINAVEKMNAAKPVIPQKPVKPVSIHSTAGTQPKASDNTRNEADKPPEVLPKNSSVQNRKIAQSFGIRVSKFRHLIGSVFPKETHITDLASLTKTMPGESDCFGANEKRIAVAIGAGGNFLAVLELTKPGRSPAMADMPGILSGTSVMDFAWDPFNCNRLAVGCDNGILQVWNIPDNLNSKLEEPSFMLRGHSERITCIKFHPCAKDIIATASSDLSICIWDLASEELKYRLIGHTDQILCIAWSSDGSRLATVSKDQKVRIFDVRTTSEPVKEGSGPKGLRGARIAWVLNNTHLAVSGFSKISERQVYLYDSKDISSPIEDISLDVSPATLIPYYDEDSSTLFLSGKGDAIIFAYEISTDSPHFHPLSHYKCSNPHQALSFLPKCVCDIRKVEFARAVRLTPSTIELISFTVPRLRVEYFQDDLFPPALQTWMPSMSSSEWSSGMNQPLARIDLKPSDMIPLIEAPPPTKPEAKPAETPAGILFDGEANMESSLAFMLHSKEREEKIVQSMMTQCELQDSDLPQEEFEGVDPSEWDEDA